MKNRLLFGALEELGDELDEVAEEEMDDVIDEGGVDTVMIAVMEDEADIDEDFDGIDKMEDGLEETEATVERLFNIASAIEQFGISRPMMMAADPHRELVAKGICPAYEELEDVPEKDEQADATAEAIKDVAAGAAKKAAEIGGKIASAAGKAANSTAVKAAVSKMTKAGAAVAQAAAHAKAAAGFQVPNLPAVTAIHGLSPMGYLAAAAILLAGAALIKLAVIIKKMVQSQKIFLVSASKKLAAVKEFDEEKFGGTEVSAYTKAEFQAAIKAGQHIISLVNTDKLLGIAHDLDAIINSAEPTEEKVAAAVKKADENLKALASDKAVTEIFGLKITVGENGLPSAVIGSPSVSPAKKSLKDLGWKAADAKAATEAAIGLTKSAEGIDKTIADGVKATSKVVETLKKHAKADAEASAIVKQAIGDIRKAIELNRTIIKAAVSGVYKVNGVAVRVANAAVKAGK